MTRRLYRREDVRINVIFGMKPARVSELREALSEGVPGLGRQDSQ